MLFKTSHFPPHAQQTPPPSLQRHKRFTHPLVSLSLLAPLSPPPQQNSASPKKLLEINERKAPPFPREKTPIPSIIRQLIDHGVNLSLPLTHTTRKRTKPPPFPLSHP